MNVMSYFHPIGSDFSKESEKLIELWRQSWTKHAWNPVLLNEEWAQRNELFHKLDLDDQNSNFYKGTNPKTQKYDRSCYCRLLAYCQYVRENGATLYADYDVMNYGFKPDILSFAEEDSHFCAERAVLYLGKEGTKQIENALIQFSSEEYKNEGSSADVYVMERYTNIFKPVLSNLETNEKARWRWYYVGHSFTDNQDETPLVHYDGGCYKRGANRELSRLEIIKQHNRL